MAKAKAKMKTKMFGRESKRQIYNHGNINH